MIAADSVGDLGEQLQNTEATYVHGLADPFSITIMLDTIPWFVHNFRALHKIMCTLSGYQ